MKVPNISAMKKLVNNFFPGGPNTSQDFVQLIRQSDGEVLGWIDESGYLQGSLAASVPEEDADAASIWLEDDFTTNMYASLSAHSFGSLGWGANTGRTGGNTLTSATGAAPYMGSVLLFYQSDLANDGLVLTPINQTINNAPTSGFPLTLNTGWEATFVFRWPTISEPNFTEGQNPTYGSRLYLGFGFDGQDTEFFTYGRPSKFIGLRFDTDPGINVDAPLSAVTGNNGDTATYNGTFLFNTNLYLGCYVTVTGFNNASNNGTFLCQSSSQTQLGLLNPYAIIETKTAAAVIVSPAIADTTYHFECVQNPAQGTNVQGAVANSGIAPDNNWHRFRMRSIVQGQILFSIDGGTEQMLSMGMDSVSGIGTRIGIVDNFSYTQFGECVIGGAGVTWSPCWGTNLLVSGSAHPGNNGSWPIADGSSIQNGGIYTLSPLTTETGVSNPNLTFQWYNLFNPVIIFGSNSTGASPLSAFMVDYFSFVYNPRLALDFNQTPNPTLPRFFNGQT